MTEPLFRADAYLREAEAKVIAVGPDGIVLDRSIFYPTGGGQPGDTGVLGHDGGLCPIANTVKGIEEGIILIPGDGAILPKLGATVSQVLNWDVRYGYMRIHTALHLLSVVIPLPVSGGSISATKGRLDFDMPEAPADKQVIEDALNAMISADHLVKDEWITDAELLKNPEMVKTMSVKPPIGSGHVRLVRIGRQGDVIDLQPCGGTHVRNTGEIGQIRLGKIEKKGRQNRRVTIHLSE